MFMNYQHSLQPSNVLAEVGAKKASIIVNKTKVNVSNVIVNKATEPMILWSIINLPKSI